MPKVARRRSAVRGRRSRPALEACPSCELLLDGAAATPGRRSGDGRRSSSARTLSRRSCRRSPGRPSRRSAGRTSGCEVATPSFWNGTAFWTTIVKTENVGPMPRPAMNIQKHRRSALGVSARSWVISAMPSRHQRRSRRRAATCSCRSGRRSGPATIELTIRPMSSGRVRDPEFVAADALDDLEPARQEDDRAEEAEADRNVETIDDA